jgi:hypothetical protein
LSSRDDDARAAANLSGIPRTARLPQSPPLNGVAVEADDWKILALAILEERRIRVTGLMPGPLIEALRRGLDGALTASADYAKPADFPEVTYLTPLPEIALTASSGEYPGPNRWQIGYTGLSNLVRLSTNTTSGPEPQFAYGIPALTANCLVELNPGQESGRVFLLTELPGSGGHAGFLISEPSRRDAALRDYLESLQSGARPIRVREVRCVWLNSPHRSDSSEKLPVGALCAVGAPTTGSAVLRPITIVVVRCPSPSGRDLILKRRSPLTDADDFGKLSLLSSRVRESDLTTALGLSVAASDEEDEAALENIWLAAGRPDPFLLPPKAFLYAAQREVAQTLGLDVGLDRFVDRGFQVVEHEAGPETQLGFRIFTLDLIRSGGGDDEYRRAISNNGSSLSRIPVATLYDQEAQLNRLLRKRKDWLKQNCFEV